MPKIVDHSERRRDIIMATWRVIARGGLAHTTTRQIAKEAGCSNGVLAHYFADRADILGSALIMAHQGVRERADERLGGSRGLRALRQLMIQALPLDEQGLLEAKIEISFWGEAIGDEFMRRIQNEEVDVTCRRIKRLLEEAQADGELKTGLSLDRIVHECMVLMDGLSIQAVMYPAQADRAEQLSLLDDLLDRIRAKPALPGTRPEPATHKPAS